VILHNFYALLNTALVYILFIPFFVLNLNRCFVFCGFAHFQFRPVEIIKSKKRNKLTGASGNKPTKNTEAREKT